MWVTALSEWRRVCRSGGQLHLYLSRCLHWNALRDRWLEFNLNSARKASLEKWIMIENFDIACESCFSFCLACSNIAFSQLGQSTKGIILLCLWLQTLFKWAHSVASPVVFIPISAILTENIFIILYLPLPNNCAFIVFNRVTHLDKCKEKNWCLHVVKTR